MNEQKTCTKCGKTLPLDCFCKDKSKKDGLRSWCKECSTLPVKRYYDTHKEQDNARNKRWRNTHKAREIIRKREWRENNREKERALNQKRRAKKKGNGGFFTDEQWQECLDFFNNLCAYSSEEFDDTNTGKVSADHIISLNNGGSSFIWNLIPVRNGYNESKNSSDMEEWYKKQKYFSEERLQRIYEWQEYAYNKWGYLEPQIS